MAPLRSAGFGKKIFPARSAPEVFFVPKTLPYSGIGLGAVAYQKAGDPVDGIFWRKWHYGKTKRAKPTHRETAERTGSTAQAQCPTGGAVNLFINSTV